MTAAGLYLRLSQDREGTALGVTRQEQDARRLAESRGWTVADVYADNDRSAYNGRTRPEYRRMLRDVEAGRIQAICA